MKSLKKLLCAATAFAIIAGAALVPVSVNAADPVSQISLNIEKELECLAHNIYYEAGGESFEGKVAVAQVTIQRTESDKYPDTVCHVVNQKTSVASKIICQFSWVCSPKKKLDPVLYKESKNIAQMVLLDGFRLTKIRDALYFHASRTNPNWNLTKVATIGGHVFYKPKSKRV
jgi:N-acetylmuramoyl-L-alanine amidase